MRSHPRSSASLGVLFALVAAAALSACDRSAAPTPPLTTDPAATPRPEDERNRVPPGMQPSPGTPGSTPAPMAPPLPSEPPATPPSPGGSGTSPTQ